MHLQHHRPHSTSQGQTTLQDIPHHPLDLLLLRLHEVHSRIPLRTIQLSTRHSPPLIPHTRRRMEARIRSRTELLEAVLPEVHSTLHNRAPGYTRHFLAIFTQMVIPLRVLLEALRQNM